MYVVQPAMELADVGARIIGEMHPANETFLVRIGNMGRDAAAAVVGWDVGQFTGFHPAADDAVAGYQRGPTDAPGATAVQLRGTEAGIWIDSDTVRPVAGDLLPVCPAFWWWDMARAPRPFAEPGGEIAFSLQMKVPTAERQGRAEVYVCVHFLLHDTTSGKSLWYGASLFDLRGPPADTVHADNWPGGTQLPILFTGLRPGSRWLRPGPGSDTFQDKPYGAYRPFDIRVNGAELTTALRALRERFPDLAVMSLNPADYRLIHVNVNPEVYAPVGSRGRLGLTVRDIRVSRIRL